jgi:uroporphyrinogen decarboxylase
LTSSPPLDGVHALPPREQWTPSARKRRDTYAITPGAPWLQREFGFYCLDRWYAEGLPRDADLGREFGYDPPGSHDLGQIGWCEAAFVPAFEVKVVEDRGEHEVYQDHAGRHLLVFKGRRDGFMPDYLRHPVKDRRTWEENVAWRMAVDAQGRFDSLERRMTQAKAAAAQGLMIVQNVIGGYMYLRSLVGPEELLYLVHDDPELLHEAMRAWFTLADAVIERHQRHVTIDEIFFGEDICFNHGPLISPAMMRVFILPYYGELIARLKARQLDRTRHLYIQIDTDGFADPVIPVYQEIGMDAMSPFEVASGCDVVAAGRQYPGLVMSGGIDKRELAKGRGAIDALVARIFPVMRERGGFCPTCDHGVPPEVSLDDYRYYRERCLEWGG